MNLLRFPNSPLLARLDRVFRHRLLLLVMPGGARTALLRRWAAGQSCPVASLALTPAHNCPVLFVAGMRQVLDAALPELDLAGELPSPDCSPQACCQDSVNTLPKRNTCAPCPGPWQELLIDLLNGLGDRRSDSVLVLDRYHLVAQPTTLSATAILIDHLPPSAHVLIAAQTDPPLPLARWLVRRQLDVLRLPALRRIAPFSTPLRPGSVAGNKKKTVT